MTDSAEKMREAIKRFHRNCCYPEAFDFEVDGLMNELAALSASGTKSEIDEAGLERAVRECARITAPEITDAEYEAIRKGKDPRYLNTCAEMRRALIAYLGEAGEASIKPIPSDPIPSQPDERERVKQVIELAMIEEAEIQYADFTDRDRQREKIIANAADAILAMQAERRGAKQDIVDLAKDLVALWTSPKISGLPRSERNAAIEDTRNAMIEAVGNLARSSVGSEQGSSNSEVTGSSPVAPATNAAVAQSAEQPFCKGTVSGSSPDGGTNTQPAPIAGLEPVAWRYWWRSKYLTYSLNEPRPDDAEPLYTRAQLEAHAAEQVRPLVEALEGLIEAVELDADEGLEGIGSYTGARLTDAKNAIRARGQV